MASGSGKIQPSANWAYWQYSYNTSDIGNAIRITLNIHLQARTFTTSSTPGFVPAMIPGTSLMSCPSDIYSKLDPSIIKNWISGKGGVYHYEEIPDAYPGKPGGPENHPPGEYIKCTLTLDIAKVVGARTVTVYFGALMRSTFMWNNLACETFINVAVPSSYTPPSNVSGRVNSSTHNSFNVTISWTNGTKSATASATDTASAGRDDTIGSNSPATGNTRADATPNKKYNVHMWVHDGTTQVFMNGNYVSYWTHPYIDNPTVSLVNGNEHSQIKVVANTRYGSDYDQYAFKLDNGSWTAWQNSNVYIFNRTSYSSITGHSAHTIYTKMKNTSSGFESNTTNASITTWYDPIYSLSVNMTNRWFWYLSVNSTVNYQGGTSNIVKYEFDIGTQGYQNKGTSNAHSRGSTSPTGSGKLAYNTNYLCKVRVTDNHGRTKEASATFKTLDERPLYLNGSLKEVKVIKPDGSISYVTPNLISVIKPDGSVTNMNNIINNDSRTQFQ